MKTIISYIAEATESEHMSLRSLYIYGGKVYLRFYLYDLEGGFVVRGSRQFYTYTKFDSGADLVDELWASDNLEYSGT